MAPMRLIRALAPNMADKASREAGARLHIASAVWERTGWHICNESPLCWPGMQRNYTLLCTLHIQLPQRPSLHLHTGPRHHHLCGGCRVVPHRAQARRLRCAPCAAQPASHCLPSLHLKAVLQLLFECTAARPQAAMAHHPPSHAAASKYALRGFCKSSYEVGGRGHNLALLRFPQLGPGAAICATQHGTVQFVPSSYSPCLEWSAPEAYTSHTSLAFAGAAWQGECGTSHEGGEGQQAFHSTQQLRMFGASCAAGSSPLTSCAPAGVLQGIRVMNIAAGGWCVWHLPKTSSLQGDSGVQIAGALA